MPEPLSDQRREEIRTIAGIDNDRGYARTVTLALRDVLAEAAGLELALKIEKARCASAEQLLAAADREQAEFHQLVGELKTEWGVNGYRDLNHEVCIIPVPEARARLVVDEAVMYGQTGITLVARRVGEWRPAGDTTPDRPSVTETAQQDAAVHRQRSNVSAITGEAQETDHA